ncbi:MAG: hypothetical protein HQ546_09590 [Planctomycetes bacterium]|nr:hypothetical protein [Planctomycetota bacterium]
MTIDFSFDRWERVKADYRRWWAGELDRPLISCTMIDRDAGRAEADRHYRNYAAIYDLAVPAEAIVDLWDYDLSCRRYLGDAFPVVWPNFGPGVMAAFIGARPGPADDTVWFHPEAEKEIADIHLRYDPDNVWFNRVKDVCRAAVGRWGGLVQIGMTDLGGGLDILSTFRHGEKLLLDLYDQPDEVKRLVWEVHDLWHRYYREIDEIIRPSNPGYTDWAEIYSAEPSYMFQCDFCHMIGPKMFDEFVKPELAASCKRQGKSFYHLDGLGQLPHLDSLLSIEALNGVQWVPGAGVSASELWFDVFEKILRAGKLAQVLFHFDLDGSAKIVDRFSAAGFAGRFILWLNGSVEEEGRVLDTMRRYGAI